MSHRFRVLSGPAQGRTFELVAGQTLTIGRGQASDTQIEDPQMSRVHCKVIADHDDVTLIDQGSSSGSFVDGNRVQELKLPRSCTIKLGASEIQFQAASAAEEKTVRAMAPNPAKAKNPPNINSLVGVELGQYRVESILTPTASGMLFKGTDTEKSRPVAIKVLTPDFVNSDEQRDRFVRAMKTMLPIRDQNIVQIYGAGKTGPFCWAAMEYIDGESLTKVIERIGIEGMLDWRQVWRVAVDIGRALLVAEKSGIVHRNVTPGNIIQRKSDKSCVLGDLMLAKAMEGTLAVAVTRPGQLIGNVAFMSPERTRGDSVGIDARSDLYGLGATCYALLTGRAPFQSDSLVELISGIRSQEPTPPKRFQLSINDLFEGIVLKLLAKPPEARYQSAAELLKELDRIGRYNSLVS